MLTDEPNQVKGSMGESSVWYADTTDISMTLRALDTSEASKVVERAHRWVGAGGRIESTGCLSIFRERDRRSMAINVCSGSASFRLAPPVSTTLTLTQIAIGQSHFAPCQNSLIKASAVEVVLLPI